VRGNVPGVPSCRRRRSLAHPPDALLYRPPNPRLAAVRRGTILYLGCQFEQALIGLIPSSAL
jgi:hypothetical protein